MRSYGQYCPVARGLDLIGERWTLLIVRELLTRGPSRHTDLKAGLPGVASNLLVDRLRTMERDGLVRREPAPPPVATTLFHLTPRGLALAPVLGHLSLWAEPDLAPPRPDETFRAHWLALPARHFLVDRTPQAPPDLLHLGAADDRLAVEVAGGVVQVHPARPADLPTGSALGAPDLLIGLITGRLTLPAATGLGLRVTGSRAVRRVLPDRRATPPRTAPEAPPTTGR